MSKSMVAKKKTRTKPTRKARRKHLKSSKPSQPKRKTVSRKVNVSKVTPTMNISIPTLSMLGKLPVEDRHVFSIKLGTISGETTIGDLIVAFPRTRDALVKHGLRFEVEEAGYLYMTLNVFSAIHGLNSKNLLQELDTISKEPPLQTEARILRQVVNPPTA